MRGEIPARCDVPSTVSRNTVSKEIITPGTTGSSNIRQPPTYQRMLSNESRNSDKDSANGKDQCNTSG